MEKNYKGNYDAEFSELVGKTITEIQGNVGDDTLKFVCSDGTKYQMHYYPDCCASCSLDDIVGDLKDLIGSPIVKAEAAVSGDPAPEIVAQRKAAYEKALAEEGEDFYWYGPSPYNGWRAESETWTFYHLATVKGSVTLRWYGSSNGYYSESVTFERLAE